MKKTKAQRLEASLLRRTPFRAGARVTFRRGMFGTWEGVIAELYVSRVTGLPTLRAVVRFTRANGTRAEARVLVDDLKLVQAPAQAPARCDESCCVGVPA